MQTRQGANNNSGSGSGKSVSFFKSILRGGMMGKKKANDTINGVVLNNRKKGSGDHCDFPIDA